MNHFSYELMAKEKIKDLQAEGMRSQAAGAAKLSLLPSWPKLLLGLLGILGLLAMFGR
jgi:hypothetical protein